MGTGWFSTPVLTLVLVQIGLRHMGWIVRWLSSHWQGRKVSYAERKLRHEIVLLQKTIHELEQGTDRHGTEVRQLEQQLDVMALQVEAKDFEVEFLTAAHEANMKRIDTVNRVNGMKAGGGHEAG